MQAEEVDAGQHGEIALIEDIIASKNGVLVPAENELYFSTLESPAEALVASRQIQIGMHAFQSKTVSVSISIDAAPRSTKTNDSGAEGKSDMPTKISPNHDLLTLVRMSRPAQILLTHDLFQQIGSFKSLPLKPFQGRFGVVEYLWTSEEKLLELQNDQSCLTEVVEDTVPQPDPMALSSSSLVHEENTGALFSHDSRTKQSTLRDSFQSQWTIAAAVTIGLALLLGGGISYRIKKHVAITPTQKVSPAGAATENSGPNQSQTNPSTTQVETPKTTDAPLVDLSKKEHSPADEPNKISRDGIDQNDSESVASGPKKGCTLSQGEINSLLQFAEQNRVQGNYDEAKQEFSKVRNCDHKNQAALEGLRRIAAVPN